MWFLNFVPIIAYSTKYKMGFGSSVLRKIWFYISRSSISLVAWSLQYMNFLYYAQKKVCLNLLEILFAICITRWLMHFYTALPLFWHIINMIHILMTQNIILAYLKYFSCISPELSIICLDPQIYIHMNRKTSF